MNKVLSFFLCAIPLILYVVVAIPLVVLSVGMELGAYDENAIMPVAFVLLVGAIILVIATYGVMIWLIVKTVKKAELSTVAKVIWSLCLYFLNVLVFPVYWFVIIRRE